MGDQWEELYQQFLTKYPGAFEPYDAELSAYDPFKFQKERIRRLKSKLDAVQSQVPSSSLLQPNGDVNYVKVQRVQYQTIIDQVNQFKDKMQKYHAQFQHNAKQIQSLKKQNKALKAATGKTHVAPGKRRLSLMACILIVAALFYPRGTIEV